jgi:lysozyme
MLVSDTGLKLIAAHEGFRSKPYLCPAQRPTIGYGSTYYDDGRLVTLNDTPITEAAAMALLRTVAAKFARQIMDATKVTLTPSQRDALTSFAYNLGFDALAASTLWRKLQAGDATGAAAQFDRWVHGGGKVLPGLVKRRAAERALFEGKSHA